MNNKEFEQLAARLQAHFTQALSRANNFDAGMRVEPYPDLFTALHQFDPEAFEDGSSVCYYLPFSTKAEVIEHAHGVFQERLEILRKQRK